MAENANSTRAPAPHQLTLIERAALALVGLGFTWLIIAVVNVIAAYRGF